MDAFESFLLRPEGLRAAVASVAHEMNELVNRGTTAGDAATTRLLTSWRELLEKLDLGPPPQLRSCPVCGRAGMRAATRCGHCWSRLEPPNGPTAEVAHVVGTA